MALLKGNSPAVIAENARSLRHGGMGEAQATMVSLKRSKKESEDAMPKQSTAPGQDFDGDSYPYGTTLNLEHETLKKLGMHKGPLPKVGKKFRIVAHANVKDASEHTSMSDGRESRRSLGLQLTRMSVE